jgi:hypothetical protein
VSALTQSIKTAISRFLMRGIFVYFFLLSIPAVWAGDSNPNENISSKEFWNQATHVLTDALRAYDNYRWDTWYHRDFTKAIERDVVSPDRASKETLQSSSSVAGVGGVRDDQVDKFERIPPQIGDAREAHAFGELTGIPESLLPYWPKLKKRYITGAFIFQFNQQDLPSVDATRNALDQQRRDRNQWDKKATGIGIGAMTGFDRFVRNASKHGVPREVAVQAAIKRPWWLRTLKWVWDNTPIGSPVRTFKYVQKGPFRDVRSAAKTMGWLKLAAVPVLEGATMGLVAAPLVPAVYDHFHPPSRSIPSYLPDYMNPIDPKGDLKKTFYQEVIPAFLNRKAYVNSADLQGTQNLLDECQTMAYPLRRFVSSPWVTAKEVAEQQLSPDEARAISMWLDAIELKLKETIPGYTLGETFQERIYRAVRVYIDWCSFNYYVDESIFDYGKEIYVRNPKKPLSQMTAEFPKGYR